MLIVLIQIEYGNETTTNYSYDYRRRMEKITHAFTNFNLKKQQEYDEVSNIKKIKTLSPSASLPTLGQIGGPVEHTYTYDTYNRLVTANGTYVGPNDEATPYLKQTYTLEMEYNNDTNPNLNPHTILKKTQTHMSGTVTSVGVI